LLHHRNSLVRLAQQFAPRAVHAFPGLLTFSVGQQFWRAVNRAVEPEYLRAFHAINTGQRLIALAVAVHIGKRSIVMYFLQRAEGLREKWMV